MLVLERKSIPSREVCVLDMDCVWRDRRLYEEVRSPNEWEERQVGSHGSCPRQVDKPIRRVLVLVLVELGRRLGGGFLRAKGAFPAFGGDR